jgi:hypothetical protein
MATSRLPDPHVLAFLTKASKGIKGAFEPEALAEALPLFGWSIEPHLVAVPLDGEQFTGLLRRLLPAAAAKRYEFGYGSAREQKYMYVSEADADDVLNTIRLHVVQIGEKDGPRDPQEGRLYVHRLVAGPYQPYPNWPPRFAVTVDGAWYAMPGWTITTPRGNVTFANKIDRGRVLSFSESAPEKVWSLMYKSGLKESAASVLESLGHETVQRVLRPTTFRELEGTGTCPCCFQNVKLNTNGRIMRHGWSVSGRRQRGAYGLTWHSGPCIGFGFKPFEVSPEGTEALLRNKVNPTLDELQKRLTRLQAKPATLTVTGYSDKPEVIPRDSPLYPRYLRESISETTHTLERVEDEKKRLEEAIATWKPRPLPGRR